MDPHIFYDPDPRIQNVVDPTDLDPEALNVTFNFFPLSKYIFVQEHTVDVVNSIKAKEPDSTSSETK